MTYFPQTWSTHPPLLAKKYLWYWGHWVKGQGHQGQMCKKRFRSITRECLDLPSSNLSHPPSLIAEGSYRYWGHWVKGRGHQNQICQNRFLSITRECLDLPSSTWSTNPSWVAEDPINCGVTRSKVTVTGVKSAKNT